MGRDNMPGFYHEPEPVWGSTVRDKRPLMEVNGDLLPQALAYSEAVTHYTVSCRVCGDVKSLSIPQSLQQAGVLRQRHLAEHLSDLAAEIQEAAR